MTDSPAGPLKRTPLYTLHRELGGRIVPFAGYEMPVQYPTGILAEHAQTRAAAGLFDVSHMGQVRLTARPGQAAAKALESGEGAAKALWNALDGIEERRMARAA